jgi:hypothetical protein
MIRTSRPFVIAVYTHEPPCGGTKLTAVMPERHLQFANSLILPEPGRNMLPLRPLTSNHWTLARPAPERDADERARWLGLFALGMTAREAHSCRVYTTILPKRQPIIRMDVPNSRRTLPMARVAGRRPVKSGLRRGQNKDTV